MNLKEIGVNTRNWADSVQDRDYWRALVNAALNLQVPQTMKLVNIYIGSCHVASTNVTKELLSTERNMLSQTAMAVEVADQADLEILRE